MLRSLTTNGIRVGLHYSRMTSVNLLSSRTKTNSSTGWAALKEIHGQSKFSFPEIESLLVQFNRRCSDTGSSLLCKEDFAKFLTPLGVTPSPETVSYSFVIMLLSHSCEGVCLFCSHFLCFRLITTINSLIKMEMVLTLRSWSLDYLRFSEEVQKKLLNFNLIL